MTERLHDLLVREADALEIPAPPAAGVVRRGRGMRRRRQALTGTVAVATVAVVAGGAITMTGRGGTSDAPDPTAAPMSGAIYAIGDQVYLDSGERAAGITDKAVKSLYYTSAGVLVRQGENSYSDGGGPQRFSLVTSDGRVRPVGVETEETVHATDIDQPYVAYGQAVRGELVVFVHDVATDEQVARISVGRTKDGWFPVSIDGDDVYVQDGYGGDVYVVDWRSGAVTRSRTLDSVWSVAGGHTVVEGDAGSTVVDVTTGTTLLRLGKGVMTTLSPDGSYVVATDQEDYAAPIESTVYEVATGAKVTVEGTGGWGWTPDDELFSLDDKGNLRTCSPSSGRCAQTEVALPEPPGEVCSTQKLPDGTKVRSCEGGYLDIILGGTIRES